MVQFQLAIGLCDLQFAHTTQQTTFFQYLSGLNCMTIFLMSPCNHMKPRRGSRGPVSRDLEWRLAIPGASLLYACNHHYLVNDYRSGQRVLKKAVVAVIPIHLLFYWQQARTAARCLQIYYKIILLAKSTTFLAMGGGPTRPERSIIMSQGRA